MKSISQHVARPWPFLGLVISLVAASGLMVHYHDCSWYGPDDGAYAHVAERILQGEILHRDVQDIHPGYINFANAAALKVFGNRLESLRYPLIVMGALGGLLVHLLLAPRGVGLGMTGAVLFTSLSWIQFLNPTAHWYCLFLLLLTVCVLTWWPRHHATRLLAVGLLLGAMLLFRQLTTVFAVMGVLTYLLHEADEPSPKHDYATYVGGRILALVMAGGLAYYLTSRVEVSAWLLFGLTPIGVLLYTCRHLQVPNGMVLRQASLLACGGLVAAAPLLTYHLYHGSCEAWYHDTIGRALALSQATFVKDHSFARLCLLGWHQLAHAHSLAERINGAYWLILPLLTLILGMVVLRGMLHGLGHHAHHHGPLPIVAVFYALVSVHYQIPVYLQYSVGVTAIALFWLASEFPSRWHTSRLAGGWVLAAIAIFFHAGQPLSRGLLGIVRGTRVPLESATIGSRCQLKLDARDAALYAQLQRLIQEQSAPTDTILALPVNPELYYLSSRRSAVRFFNSLLGISSPQECQAVMAQLDAQPPALVFYRPEDKYHTPYASQIILHLQPHYELRSRIGDLEVYGRKGVALHDISDHKSSGPTGPKAPSLPTAGPRTRVDARFQGTAS